MKALTNRPSTSIGVLLQRSGAVALCQLQHGIGHIQAVGKAGGADAARRQEYVNAPSAAQVEHTLPWCEFGQRSGVAAAERGQRGGHRDRAKFRLGVEVGGDDAGITAVGGAAPRGLLRLDGGQYFPALSRGSRCRGRCTTGGAATGIDRLLAG